MKRVALGIAVLWSLGGHAARADQSRNQAKVLYEKATAEFGLGNYAQAAEHFETAFSLKPDEALLYDAAEAHNLAGNKKRALELFHNFVRLYGGKSPRAAAVKNKIAELERPPANESPAPATPVPAGVPAAAPPAIAATPEKPASSDAGAVAVAATPVQPTPAPPPALASPPIVVEQASPAPVMLVGPESPQPAPRRSLFASPWFWAGAGVLAVVAVSLLVVLNPSYPDASLGHTDVGK